MSYRDAAGTPRHTVGVVGALGLEKPGTGILPHEETTPKAKTDRLELLRATRANLSPIWGLSPAAGLSAALEPPAHPAEHTTDPERVAHELWPITEPAQIDAIRALVESQPVLIADGHHRFETTLTYREEQARDGNHGQDEDFVMALVVELTDEQLTVQAIHRLLTGLPPGFDLPAALEPWFDLTPTAPADRTIVTRMAEAGALTVLTRTGVWLAWPRDSVSDTRHPRPRQQPPGRHARRVAPVRGRLPARLGPVRGGGSHRPGECTAAVLLRPPSVDQIASISHGGVRMPPKTTFFWPKPRTGMVVRELLS